MTADHPARAVRLLDVEADLGADFDADTFAIARDQILAPVVSLGPGLWTPAELATHPSVRGRLLGGIIVSGLSVREVVLAGRVCTHLHGPGDLVAYDETHAATLPLAVAYSVPDRMELALLDDRFLAASRRWPRLAGRLLDLASQQIRRATTHQAISQLPRVEDRLIALFWHLADRWGQVRRDGIVIRLALTHEALGCLIGARRPTISLGLRALAETSALTRTADGDWRLDPGSVDALAGQDVGPRRMPSALGYREVPVAPTVEVGPSLPPDRAALLERVAALRTTHELRRTETNEILARSNDIRDRTWAQLVRLGSSAAA